MSGLDTVEGSQRAYSPITGKRAGDSRASEWPISHAEMPFSISVRDHKPVPSNISIINLEFILLPN